MAIETAAAVTDVCAQGDRLYAGLMDGRVAMWRVGRVGGEAVWSVEAHPGSAVRRLAAQDGLVVSVAADRSLAVTHEEGRVRLVVANACGSELHALAIVTTNPLRVAVGDEGGNVHLLTLARDGQAADATILDGEGRPLHGDFVADLCYSPRRRTLFSAGSDGRLVVVDTANRKGGISVVASCDGLEEEIHGVCVVGKRAVCAALDGGAVGVFRWSDWGEMRQKLSLSRHAVNAVATVDEERIVAGTSDGALFVLNVVSRLETDSSVPLARIPSVAGGIERLAVLVLADGSRVVAATTTDISDAVTGRIHLVPIPPGAATAATEQQEKTRPEADFYADLQCHYPRPAA